MGINLHLYVVHNFYSRIALLFENNIPEITFFNLRYYLENDWIYENKLYDTDNS